VGERQDLGADLEETLQAAGVYHVVAVSGFNVACVSAAAAALITLLPGGPRPRRLALLAVVALYGALARPSGSIARAALMVLVHGVGILAGRRTSPIGSVAVSAILLMVHRPAWLADPGFQLSYAATLGLFATPLRPHPRPAGGAVAGGRTVIGPGLRLFGGVAGASLTALVATAPLAARHFQRVSPAGLAANLVAVPTSAICLLLGFLALTAAPALPTAATLAIALAGTLLNAIERTATWCAALPGGSLWVLPPSWGLVLTLFAALTATCFAGRRRTRSAAAMAALLLAVAGIARGRLHPVPGDAAGGGRIEVVVLDVGQGDAVLVRLPSGTAMLIDAGGMGGTDFDVGARVVSPALRAMGLLRLDILVVTHAHRDHLGGAAAILRQFRPDALWFGDLPAGEAAVRHLETTAAELGIAVLRPRRGVRLRVGGARIDVSHPGGPRSRAPDVNNQSLVLRITHGRRAVLLTGDIEGEVERDMVARGAVIAADLLKVPHHGSDTSSGEGFLQAVAPRLALISAGSGNPWGHPSAKVVSRLARLPALIGRTDRDGALRAVTDGLAPWRLTTWRLSEDLWGHGDEAEDEDQQSEERHQPSPGAERPGVVERGRMSHTDDGEQHPEEHKVISPDQEAEDAEHDDAGARDEEVRSGRQGVEHVPTVELADRQEIQRGGEQPEPGGGEGGVQPDGSGVGSEVERVEPVEQEARRQPDVARLRRPGDDGGARQAVEKHRESGHEPRDRPGDPHVEQSPPVGERRADADDGAECSEQVRARQEEGERGIDPIDAAGDVVPHLVRAKDEKHGRGVGHAVQPGLRVADERGEQSQGDRLVPNHHGPGQKRRDHRRQEADEVDPGWKGPAAADGDALR
jgi:competence protein ComEC